MDKETALLLSKISANNYMILVEELNFINKALALIMRTYDCRLDLVRQE